MQKLKPVTLYFGTQGYPLLFQHSGNDMNVLTVENCENWNGMVHILDAADDNNVIAIDFPNMDSLTPHCCGDAPNPDHVIEWSEATNTYLDPLALDMITGRYFRKRAKQPQVNNEQE